MLRYRRQPLRRHVLFRLGRPTHGRAPRSQPCKRIATAFDDGPRACFFGVSADPQDEAQHRLTEAIPGIRSSWITTAW